MHIAYLVNQYPKLSHSFIRREIAALEQAGHTVERYSIRASMEGEVEPNDCAELERTHVILRQGIVALCFATLRQLARSPLSTFGALGQAMRLGLSSERGVFRHLIYLVEACWLARALRSTAAQHLHAHFGTNSATVAMLCRTLGGPGFSFTVHGPEEFDKPLSIGMPSKIATASAVVAISSFGRSQLMRWSEASCWNRLHVVRCGLDERFLTPQPTAVPGDRRLVCVGRLCEQKGQLLLVQACHLLRLRGVAFALALVGDGPMRSSIEEAVDRLDLRKFVTITGWADEERVREEIAASRCLVLPSFAEGLPVVIMEAMALGRPVISTYIGGIPELVKPGESGWLVPAGDSDALAEAMQQAIEASPEQLAEMGRSGRQAVLSRHDVQKEAAKLAALFEAAVGTDVSSPSSATAHEHVDSPPPAEAAAT